MFVYGRPYSPGPLGPVVAPVSCPGVLTATHDPEISPEQTAGSRRARLWLLVGSVATVAGGGWINRWMSDDGFIYLRVVEQIWAGNGPVFNAGERVEVATGPLWLWLLAGARTVPAVPLEWWAVLLGLFLTAVGVGLAAAAGMRAAGDWRGGLGVLAFAAMPFAWHFASSGLETGLGFAWLGAASLVVVAGSQWQTTWLRTAGAALVIGLGVLIRPDFALISGILIVAVGWRLRSSGRLAAFLIGALLIPTVYQVFRMAYFRSVLPNTAIAKEAGMARWDHGLAYLADSLRNPLAAVVGLTGLIALWAYRRQPDLALLAAAGSVYGLAVVRAGGDFMRARMLLPALLLLAVAGAATRVWRLRLIWPILILAAPIGLYDGAVYQTGFSPWIHNERMAYPQLSHVSRPVVLADLTKTDLVTTGYRARSLAASGQTFLIDRHIERTTDLDPSPTKPFTVISGPIGMLGYSAGTGVHIADRYSLADPIGARLVLTTRTRPGHEKVQADAWILASLETELDESATTAAAVRRCDRPANLLSGISDPLSLDVAWTNFIHALPDTFLRIPAEPLQAQQLWCHVSP